MVYPLIRTAALKSVFSAILCATVFPAAAEPFYWQNVTIGGGGGFIPGIIYSETEKDLVYARTDMGGLYRRDKTSGKWIPLTDWVAPEDWNLLGGESFAIDPVHPSIVYFAAGTYTNDWTDRNGVILRSTDYGDSWTGYEMPIKFGGNMPGRSMGERLAIDPNSTNILYFGARSGNGLWKSTDSGVTWSRVTSFPVTGDFVQDPDYPYTADPIGIVWVAFDKSSATAGTPTNRIFAGVAQSSGPTVYMSENAGSTWSAITGQPLGPDTNHIMPHHGVLRNGVLYIPYSNKAGPYDGDYGEIWKYDIASGSWTDVSPHSHLQDEAWGGSDLQSEDAYYGYGGFAVDPQNPQVIMAATLNSWWPDAAIFRSEDGGDSWTKSYYWTSYPSAEFKYTIDSSFVWLNWGVTSAQWPDVVEPKLGWMIGDLEIDPFDSDKMLYGTGATIYGTENLTDWGSATKVRIRSVADGVEECAVLSLAVPPIASGANADVKLITGVGDIGGFTHTSLSAPAQMFLTPRFSRTSGIDYAELDPNQVVRVGTADPDQYEAKNNLATSSNGGKSWSKVYALDTTYANGSVAMSADGAMVIWAAENKDVYAGAPYGLAKTNLPQNSLVASDRVNANTFYAFHDSLFYYGSGSSFTAASNKLPFGSSMIKAVPGREGHVWIPGGKAGLWRTINGGQSFSQLDTSVVQQADIVGYGKADSGMSYPAIYITGKVSGRTGVFLSTDSGSTWTRINDNAHQYGSINYAITGDMRQFGIVFVGTNGRGVVYGDIHASANDTSSGNTVAVLPTQRSSFGLNVRRMGSSLWVTDAPVGASIEVFTLQGARIVSRAVSSAAERFDLPAHTLYLVRMHYENKTLQQVR